jgi:hypothetical protein
MPRLLDFLFQNPILIFVLVAWAAGMVGNVVKAAGKRRESAEQQRRMPSAPPAVRPQARPQAHDRSQAGGRPTEADVAAEMRRILGMDQPPKRVPASQRPGSPAGRPQPPPLPTSKPRRLVDTERPPAPMMATAQQRHLEIHVDPHVGEQIGKREVLSRPRVEASAMGSLGGRVQSHRRVHRTADRYPRTNLRQALVLSEILGPPLALRPPDPSRPQ